MLPKNNTHIRKKPSLSTLLNQTRSILTTGVELIQTGFRGIVAAEQLLQQLPVQPGDEANKPSDQAVQASEYLKTRILKSLPEGTKLATKPATATSGELIAIPSNTLESEVLLLFITKYITVPTKTDEDYKIQSHFLITLDEFEKFKSMQKEWILFMLPFTKMQLLLSKQESMEVHYTYLHLLLFSKNKDERVYEGKDVPLLQIPLNDIPDYYERMQKFLKFYYLAKKHPQVIRCRVMANQINLFSSTNSLQITGLPLSHKSVMGVDVFAIEMSDIHLLSDSQLQSIDEKFGYISRAITAINIFSKKYNATIGRYHLEFQLVDDCITVKLDPRHVPVLQPLVEYLNVHFDEKTKIPYVTLADAERAASEDLTDLIAQIQANEIVVSKYERLKAKYGARFVPPVTQNGVVVLRLEELNQQEQALLIEDNKATIAAETLQKNISIIQQMLPVAFTCGKNWLQSNDTLCLQPLTVPAVVVLRLANIPGLVITAEDKPKAEITLPDLQAIDSVRLKQLVTMANELGVKIDKLDMIVCILRIKANDRFTATGIQFQFKDNEYYQAFVELWKPYAVLTRNANDCYEIPYAVCQQENITVKVLTDIRSALEQRFLRKAEVKKEEQHLVRRVHIDLKKNKGDKPVNNHHVSKPKAKKPENTVSNASATKVKVRRGPEVAQQPAERAAKVAPTGISKEVLQQVANAVIAHHDFTANDKMSEQRKVEIQNAHEGAILYELDMLENGALWYEGRQTDKLAEEEYHITHLYSTELALMRLMNAIDLRHELVPDDHELTENDGEAKRVRAEIIHGLPTLACLMNISHHIRHDCRFKEVVVDLLQNKRPAYGKLKLLTCMNLFHHVDMDAMQIITQTMTDLTRLVAFFDKHMDKIRSQVNISHDTCSRLFQNKTDFFGYEARAIQGCIVKLGELSVHAAELYDNNKISNQVMKFLLDCKKLRNVTSHNNVYSDNFDPLPLEVVYQTASTGAKLLNNSKN